MRAPKPVTVELAERLSDTTMIINESYSKTYRHNEAESLIIYNQLRYSISGKLCVKDDGSVYVRNPGELNDASCKYITSICIASYVSLDYYLGTT